eukprot:gene12405-26099_t
MSSDDVKIKRFMQIALDEAQTALNSLEVPVGCVFVEKLLDGGERILGKGYNKTNLTRNGTKHAELVAIDDIVLNQNMPVSVFKQCDLYVTCEPCIMCAAAIRKLGINHVYYGCSNERFGGNGSILNVQQDNVYGTCNGYTITPGILRNEAIELFKDFYSQENKRAPAGKRKIKSSSRESTQTSKGIRLAS